MPRTKNQTDKTPRKRRGVKTTHIRVSLEKKPYIVELVKKPLGILKGLIEDQKEEGRDLNA